MLDDANEWYDKVVFPTKEVIDSWDWEGSKAVNEANLKPDLFWDVVICTGWSERVYVGRVSGIWRQAPDILNPNCTEEAFKKSATDVIDEYAQTGRFAWSDLTEAAGTPFSASCDGGN